MVKDTGVIVHAGSWLILQCDIETIKYYQYWLKKQGILVNTPIWKAHISVVRGEETPGPLSLYNHEIVEFTYSPDDIGENGDYWWIRIQSSRLEEIRQELHLPAQPEYPLHMTIGKTYHYT